MKTTPPLSRGHYCYPSQCCGPSNAQSESRRMPRSRQRRRRWFGAVARHARAARSGEEALNYPTRIHIELLAFGASPHGKSVANNTANNKRPRAGNGLRSGPGLGGPDYHGPKGSGTVYFSNPSTMLSSYSEASQRGALEATQHGAKKRLWPHTRLPKLHLEPCSNTLVGNRAIKEGDAHHNALCKERRKSRIGNSTSLDQLFCEGQSLNPSTEVSPVVCLFCAEAYRRDALKATQHGAKMTGNVSDFRNCNPPSAP